VFKNKASIGKLAEAKIKILVNPTGENRSLGI